MELLMDIHLIEFLCPEVLICLSFPTDFCELRNWNISRLLGPTCQRGSQRFVLRTIGLTKVWSSNAQSTHLFSLKLFTICIELNPLLSWNIFLLSSFVSLCYNCIPIDRRVIFLGFAQERGASSDLPFKLFHKPLVGLLRLWDDSTEWSSFDHGMLIVIRWIDEI